MRRNVYLSDALHDFVAASGNVSGYVQDLIARRIAEYADARATLAAWTYPMLSACMDATNGLMWTPGMSERDQITADLEDADDLAEKWGIGADDWARLVGMTETEARAVRVVSEEFWGGRAL